MGADLELVAGGRPLRFPAVWLRDYRLARPPNR